MGCERWIAVGIVIAGVAQSQASLKMNLVEKKLKYFRKYSRANVTYLLSGALYPTFRMIACGT